MWPMSSFLEIAKLFFQEISGYIPKSSLYWIIPILWKIYLPSDIGISQEFWIESIFCVTDYSISWKYLKEWKYYSSDDSKILLDATLEWTAVQYKEYFSDFDYIVPFPIWLDRYIFRWFNQSYHIARVLADTLWISIFHGVFRAWSWWHQSRLSKVSRINRIFRFFMFWKKYVRWKKVLIVDDVISTGTSCTSLSNYLFSCWVSSVSVLVLARNDSKIDK